MKYCALICQDKPGSHHIRQATRQAHLDYIAIHLDYIAILAIKVAFAGFFSDEDDKPNGSLIVLKVSTVKQAEQIAQNDPCNRAGLFNKVDIKPSHWTMNAPAQ